jgi:protein-S-isoprenylcysteine O-methyltransferase Ste14
MLRFTIVWLGGAIFVIALGWCVLWYGVALARPAGPRGWQPLLVDALLFGVFAIHHSVFAREHVKAAVGRALPAELVRSFYVWIASALLIMVCVLWQPVGGDLYDHGGVAAAAHALAQLAGFWLIARSVGAIDPLELAGIRDRTRGDEGLQVGGVYALVRHPIYLGWILLVFGAAHMTGDRLAFAVISTAYLALAVPWEERSLVKTFGEEYVRYTRLVRWRMLPFIY